MSHPHLSNLHHALLSEEKWARQEHHKQCQLAYLDRIAVGVSWPLLRCHGDPEYQRGKLLLNMRQTQRAALHDGIRAGDLVDIHPAHRHKNSIMHSVVLGKPPQSRSSSSSPSGFRTTQSRGTLHD